MDTPSRQISRAGHGTERAAGLDARSRRQSAFLTRVLMLAVDTGVRSWGTCTAYRWWLSDQDASDESVDHAPCRPNAYATIHLTPSGVDGAGVSAAAGHRVDLDVIEAGIAHLTALTDACEVVDLDGRLAVLRAWFSLDSAGISPSLADAILQAGLFGIQVFPTSLAS